MLLTLVNYGIMAGLVITKLTTARRKGYTDEGHSVVVIEGGIVAVL